MLLDPRRLLSRLSSRCHRAGVAVADVYVCKLQFSFHPAPVVGYIFIIVDGFCLEADGVTDTHCVRLVSSATVSLSHIAPATSQVIVFFSHTTPAPACRTQCTLYLFPVTVAMAFGCPWLILCCETCLPCISRLFICSHLFILHLQLLNQSESEICEIKGGL